MKNTISYFRYQIKNNLRTFIYITVVSQIFTFVIGLNAQPEYHRNGDYWDYHSTLYLPVIVLCILCYLIPLLQFSVFKKRRNLDCYYSLPLHRRAIGIVHYTVGLILVFLPFTLCYLQNLILLLTRGADYFHFGPMIGHFFLCYLMGWIMYTFFVFVFNEANSRVDGCLFLTLWTFAFSIIGWALHAVDILSDREFSDSIYLGMPWMMINDITTVYQKVIQKDGGNLYEFWSRPCWIFWFVFWLVVGVVALVGFVYFFGKRKTEKTGEISDSWFGFRTLIPLWAACFLIITQLEIVFYIITLIMTFVGYTIYRRGFRYKLSDFIVMGTLALFLVGKIF